MSEISHDVDLDLLKSSIDDHIVRLRRNRKRDKGKTSIITLFSAFAAASTTALIGLSKYFPDSEIGLQSAALIVSALVTIILSWDKLFEHKKLWIQSSRGLNHFYELKEDIGHAEKTETLDQDMLRLFYIRYKLIINNLNSAWENLRNRDAS